VTCKICRDEILVMTPPEKDICSQNCLLIYKSEGHSNGT